MKLSVQENILPFEAKHFYRRLEMILSSVDRTATKEFSAQMFLSAFHNELADVFQISSSHLYELSETPQLLSAKGEPIPDTALDFRMQIRQADVPWFGNSNGRFTAMLPFDNEASLMLVFFARENVENEQFLSWAFSSIHYALIQHFRRMYLHDSLEQARAVQMSLLPSHAPQYEDFEFAAKSIPAKIVGGDVYDFQMSDSNTMWLLIADAAGHGLPAALQARDVITGIRMGMEKGIPLPSLTEKLNRVIHRSGLVSRFISLVVGELMADGSFLYVNAGHPAPILLRDGGFIELCSGGMILGFARDNFYNAGNVSLEAGDLLLMYTDGLIEHISPQQQEFGKERLQDWMMRWKDEPLDLAVDNLFDRLRDYGAQQPFRDDATVVLVRKKYPISVHRTSNPQ